MLAAVAVERGTFLAGLLLLGLTAGSLAVLLCGISLYGDKTEGSGDGSGNNAGVAAELRLGDEGVRRAANKADVDCNTP